MNLLAVEEAHRLIRDEGLSANKASDRVAEPLGVTGRTVKRWAQEHGTPLGEASQDTAKNARTVQADLNAARREGLKADMLDKAFDVLARMDEPHIDFRGKDVTEVTFPRATSADVRNYAVAFAILVDKMRLEEGKSTSREERVDHVSAAAALELFVAEAEAHANAG